MTKLRELDVHALQASICRALDIARVRAQDAAAHAGIDLAAVDREVAAAAYRWGLALREELAIPRGTPPGGTPLFDEADL